MRKLGVSLALIVACSAPPNAVSPTPPYANADTDASASASANASADADAAAEANPDEDASTPTTTPTTTPTATSTATATSSPPPDMLLVPGGSFTMGADRGGEDDEHPAHAVELPAFWLDRTEVTQSEYQKCVDDHRCTPPAWYVLKKGGPKFAGPNKPVTGVTWSDATAFCSWKGKRLPHEAEFEKAVRGTDARRYPWGNDAPTPEITVFATSWPDDVGAHPKGRGPFGHDDLAGNVWEWTADDYDPLFYARSTAKDGVPGTCAQIVAAQNDLRRQHREGFTGSNPIPFECDKSIRGGAYNYDAWGLRSTNRVHHPGTFHLLMTGFRCAKDT